MGRLDNIIERNRRPNQMRERMIVSLVFGSIILLILGLTVFTDLGAPPEDPADHAVVPDRGRRIDGVMLRRQPVKPVGPATARPPVSAPPPGGRTSP